MGVSPSGQDDAQMEQFCKMYGGDQDAWIRGILNKKGDAEFTVYFQCGKSWKPIKDVPWEIIPDVEDERHKFWKGIVDQRVKGFTETRTGAYVPMGVPLAGQPPYQHQDYRDRSKDIIVPTRHPRGGSGRRKEWWT